MDEAAVKAFVDALDDDSVDHLVVANAAIEAMVKTLACSYGYEQKRVRVNCLSPGMTMTPVYQGADGEVDPAILAYQQKTAEEVPLQRNGQPEEMAHAIYQLQTNTFI